MFYKVKLQKNSSGTHSEFFLDIFLEEKPVVGSKINECKVLEVYTCKTTLRKKKLAA